MKQQPDAFKRDMRKEEERKYWIDYLRAIACMLVVLVHTSAPYLNKLANIPMLSWHVGNIIDSFSRISVPLFFMISGYLFFGDKKPKLKNYIRILAALTFYSLMSYLYFIVFRDIDAMHLLRWVISKPAFYHLWFLYSLIFVYIFANIVNTRLLDNKSIVFFLIIIFVVINPSLSALFSLANMQFKSWFQMEGVEIYFILYAVFGSLIGNSRLTKPWLSIFLPMAVYISSSIFVAYFTYILSVKNGKYIGTFYDYTNFLVALGAVSIFSFVKENDNIFRKIHKPLSAISRNSLAIYGIHTCFLDFFDLHSLRFFNYPFLDIFCIFIATFMLSFIFSLTVRVVDRYRLVT